jgi:hypothetical protein
MKTVTRSFKTMALIACGVFFLSLLGGNAVAAKRPQRPELWPKGATLDVSGRIYRSGTPPRPLVDLYVDWPLAIGADHYRVTWVIGPGGHRILLDESPAPYSIGSQGEAAWGTTFEFPFPPSITLKATVTAYSGPDEATAYSESLQATLTLP